MTIYHRKEEWNNKVHEVGENDYDCVVHNTSYCYHLLFVCGGVNTCLHLNITQSIPLADVHVCVYTVFHRTIAALE